MVTKNIQDWVLLVAAWTDPRAWIITDALTKAEVAWNLSNDNTVAVPDKQISADDISKHSIDANAFTAFIETVS